MRKVLIAVAAFGLLAGAACGSDSKDEAKTPTSDNMGAAPAATIKASGTTWSPDEVSIKVGDTVEWDVDGSVVHDLKGDEGVEHKASSSFKVTHTYDKAGTFSFQCTIHPGMTGTVEVA
jgi:plastocyanin